MRTFSLKTQISGVIMLSAALLMIGIGALHIRGEQADIKTHEKRYLDDLVRRASGLAYVVTSHFVENDFAFMNRLVTHAGKRQYSIYVRIVDTQNRILAKNDGAALGSVLEIPQPFETVIVGEGVIRKYPRDGKEYFDVSYPIKAGDLVLGAVRMGFTAEWLNNEKTRLKKVALFDFAVMVFIIAAGVAVSSWLIRVFIAPVIQLKEAAEKVGKGDYRQSVKVKNSDEIGVLTDSFNRMVENLRISSEQLVEKKFVDSIIANMHDALVVLAPDGRIRMVNDTTLALSGYWSDELLDKSAGILFQQSPGDPDTFSDLKKKWSLADTETNLVTKDGRKIPVLLSCSVINDNNTVRWIVCVAKDITERKRSEENLKLFSKAIDEAMDGVHIVDLEGRIIYANRAAEEMYSYSRGELIGKHVDELNVDREFARTVVLPAVKEKGSWSGELMRRHKNGYEFPVWLSASMVRNDHGEPIAMLGLIRDMTDRKHAEELLNKALAMANEEKTRAEAIIAAIGDQMVILDPEFNIIYENDLAIKAIGSHIGRKCYSAYENSDAVCVNCPVALSFTDGLIHRGERIAETIVGTMHLDICASPLKDESGRVVAVIEMVRDITDRKQAEELLRKSHEGLEKQVEERTAELTLLNEQLRRFAHNLQEAREQERTIIAREIHDELGQALTALKMDLSILTRKLPKGEKKIDEKTESMAGLIETTIQNVKRISTDLRPGVLDHLGLTSALDWQAEEFQKRTGIFCDVVCEPEEIVVDRARSTTIFRLFQETLTNVARHANASKVSVLLKREDGELILQVKDDGDGITKDQLSDTHSLGIAGMRERVNYWGGSLAISGIRNKGTTVDARIPLGAAGETV